MRMVSNRHVTGASVKRFKKVHVQHKAYVVKPVEKAEEKEPVVVVEDPVVEEVQEEVLETPKPRRRSKKVEETLENNEEKPEYDG